MRCYIPEMAATAKRNAPGADDGRARIPAAVRARPEISDINDPGQLIRYALAAQVARLDGLGISQQAVADAAACQAAKLSNTLNGKTIPESAWLRDLDRAMVALAPELEPLGGLTSLSIRVRGLTTSASLISDIPAGWTWELLRESPDTELSVMNQASALLAQFIAVERANRSPARLRGIHPDKLPQLATRLALIGGAPPTPRNIDALVLLGSLTKYAFDKNLAYVVTEQLKTSPLGFRLWRAVTKLVHLCEEAPQSSTQFQRWVGKLLEDAEEIRKHSIYPARSLDLELAIAIPADWAEPGDAQVHRFLLTRAKSPDASVRERGTAAHGLWQRTLAHNPDFRTDHAQRGRVDRVEAELRELAAEFRGAGPENDSGAGFRWVAATLESVLDRKALVCNDWPELDPPERWFAVVQEAADTLDEVVNERVLGATRTLFLHTLLQNSGVQRRQAVDTLVAGGWTSEVVHALSHVLRNEKEQSWLRVRALFGIGFLQRRDAAVADDLAEACKEAYAKLVRDPTPAQIKEMHAALFAIGDCFGVAFAARDTEGLKIVRRSTARILRDLAQEERFRKDERFFGVARALAYVLTFIAQDRKPEQPGKEDITEELLKRLSDHDDAVTREFCRWTLRFRYAPDGRVQSLLHAADIDDV